MGLGNVLAAAMVGWVVCWIRLRGRPGGRSLTAALVSALAMLIGAGFLRHVYAVSGLTAGLPLAFVAGLGVGLFFIAPILVLSALGERRPLRPALVDGGGATLVYGLMGALLVAF